MQRVHGSEEEIHNPLELIEVEKIVSPFHAAGGGRSLQSIMPIGAVTVGLSSATSPVNVSFPTGLPPFPTPPNVSSVPANNIISNGGRAALGVFDNCLWSAAYPASCIAIANRSSMWVGLYTPANSDPSKTTPIRYQALIWDPNWLTTGIAALNFQLPNLHTGGYVAYIFLGDGPSTAPGPFVALNAKTQAQLAAQAPATNGLPGQSTTWGGTKKPWVSVNGINPTGVAASGTNNFGSTAFPWNGIVMGSSLAAPPWQYWQAPPPEGLTFDVPNLPTHVRLTPGSAESSYTITWNQNADSMGGVVTVYAMGNMMRFPANISDITVNMTCANSPASTTGWRAMGRTWSATIDMSPAAGNTIQYTVGDAITTSPQNYTFIVPPLAAAAAYPVSYMLFADMGFGSDNSSDQGWEGRNYNDGKAALSIARRAAAHVSGLAQPRISALVINGDLTCVAAAAVPAPPACPPSPLHTLYSRFRPVHARSYADGYMGQWEEWFEMLSGALPSVPLFYSGGNHGEARA